MPVDGTFCSNNSSIVAAFVAIDNMTIWMTGDMRLGDSLGIGDPIEASK